MNHFSIDGFIVANYWRQKKQKYFDTKLKYDAANHVIAANGKNGSGKSVITTAIILPVFPYADAKLQTMSNTQARKFGSANTRKATEGTGYGSKRNSYIITNLRMNDETVALVLGMHTEEDTHGSLIPENTQRWYAFARNVDLSNVNVMSSATQGMDYVEFKNYWQQFEAAEFTKCLNGENSSQTVRNGVNGWRNLIAKQIFEAEPMDFDTEARYMWSHADDVGISHDSSIADIINQTYLEYTINPDLKVSYEDDINRMIDKTFEFADTNRRFEKAKRTVSEVAQFARKANDSTKSYLLSLHAKENSAFNELEAHIAGNRASIVQNKQIIVETTAQLMQVDDELRRLRAEQIVVHERDSKLEKIKSDLENARGRMNIAREILADRKAKFNTNQKDKQEYQQQQINLQAEYDVVYQDYVDMVVQIKAISPNVEIEPNSTEPLSEFQDFIDEIKLVRSLDMKSQETSKQLNQEQNSASNLANNVQKARTNQEDYERQIAKLKAEILVKSKTQLAEFVEAQAIRSFDEIESVINTIEKLLRDEVLNTHAQFEPDLTKYSMSLQETQQAITQLEQQTDTQHERYSEYRNLLNDNSAEAVYNLIEFEESVLPAQQKVLEGALHDLVIAFVGERVIEQLDVPTLVPYENGHGNGAEFIKINTQQANQRKLIEGFISDITILE
ncbi:hypothetical protein EQG49_03175 [Periweissella cryptocerci]|uniref:Uncharacterized protein n=1 Tax=Periweissella cryptocerci TaxID=2506420 RepID=A0A4P6YS77_9LACO|nr:hypothetical protein [Periweissella cryptocerci]QBO35527.1 hypothetical protein EQG49_03175 [Periweissella cryptocerci]